MTLFRNIKTQHGATGDGVTDDAGAFLSFQAWAVANQGSSDVQLTIPAGTYMFLSDNANSFGSGNNKWSEGIKNLVVAGAGANVVTLSNGGVVNPHFTFGGSGLHQDNAHSARTATVLAGASSVTLLTPAQAVLFTVGQYAMMTGFDVQGHWQSPFGFPCNPHFFEPVKVLSIVGAVITFDAPLKNTYKSTWPNFNSGNASEIDAGGPATLYVLNPTWDTTAEYRDLTIDQSVTAGAVSHNGRALTFRNVTGTPGTTLIASQNLVFNTIGCSFAGGVIEADKLVGTWNVDGCLFNEIDFQSSSIDLLVMSTSSGATLRGTPKKAVLSNSTITNLDPGATSFGRSDELDCTNCVIGALSPAGVVQKGPSNAGVNVGWTMAGGVITIPNALSVGSDENQLRGMVPGTWCMWQGASENETMFQVLDVTQDATNCYVYTNLSGGFPAVALDHGKLYIRTHPAPSATFINCTGCADVVDISQAPPGAPLYSYSKRSYTPGTLSGGVGPGAKLTLWGNLKKATVTVSPAFTGTGALKFNLSQSDNWPVVLSDFSAGNYGPAVNAINAGARVVTLSGVSNPQALDTGLAVPDAGRTWFTGQSNSGPTFSVDVSGQASGPTVTVEIQTDQGFPLGRNLRGDF